MAGITASTVSVDMSSSEGVDLTKGGYVAGEVCTLATEPAGDSHLWTLAPPPGSLSRLSGETAASPSFKIDRGGIYVVVCVVDGSTVYKARLDATKVTVDWAAHGVRLSAVDPDSVPTPSTGKILFINADNSNLLSTKDSAGTVAAV